MGDAREVISNLWGASEVDKAIEEFQSVLKGDRGEVDSKWSELLEEPHLRGCIKVLFGFKLLWIALIGSIISSTHKVM